MPRSPQSRGKGSRRVPGRDGGIKKRKPGLPDVRPSSPDTTWHSWWTVIKPFPLSKAYRDHPWVFAAYWEWNRRDGVAYCVFLLRNCTRTVYGIREWLGAPMPKVDTLKKLARQVIIDPSTRTELISDDPDLHRLWRRR